MKSEQEQVDMIVALTGLMTVAEKARSKIIDNNFKIDFEVSMIHRYLRDTKMTLYKLKESQ